MHTELFRPEDVVREKAVDDVVADGVHVGGGGLGEEGGDVEDVAYEELGGGPTHSLPLHHLLDASRSQPVTRDGRIGNSQEPSQEECQDRCHSSLHSVHAWLCNYMCVCVEISE